MQTAAKIGIVLLVALALAALPGGGGALRVTLTLLSIAFFAGVAYLVYRGYRQYRFELDSLGDRQRLVLYSSAGLAMLTFCGTGRMFDAGGLGVLAWLALLGLCSFGIYWVWNEYRSMA